MAGGTEDGGGEGGGADLVAELRGAERALEEGESEPGEVGACFDVEGFREL